MKTEVALKLGGTVDSWCGKCKRILAHTIEAIVGQKPARVHCNTCQAQHTYKPYEPGAGSVPQPPKTRANRYQALLKGKDMTLARSYSTKESYSPGDVMQHPTFGFGVTTAIKDHTKIEVLFESGPKVLVHGR
jgi:hypothetical protein